MQRGEKTSAFVCGQAGRKVSAAGDKDNVAGIDAVTNECQNSCEINSFTGLFVVVNTPIYLLQFFATVKVIDRIHGHFCSLTAYETAGDVRSCRLERVKDSGKIF